MNNLNDSRLNLATTFEGAGGLYIFLNKFYFEGYERKSDS